MFGKAEWFAEKQMGQQISPATWQGWIYVAAWAAATVGPFLVLIGRHQGPEAFIWLAAAVAALWRETRQLRTAVRRRAEANLFYIGDDEKDRVATENYDFSLRA